MVIVRENRVCSTALTSTGWVGSTYKALLHCPCCQLTRKHQEERNLGNAEIQTRGRGARSKYAIHCAMRPQTSTNSLMHPLMTSRKCIFLISMRIHENHQSPTMIFSQAIICSTES